MPLSRALTLLQSGITVDGKEEIGQSAEELTAQAQAMQEAMTCFRINRVAHHRAMLYDA